MKNFHLLLFPKSKNIFIYLFCLLFLTSLNVASANNFTKNGEVFRAVKVNSTKSGKYGFIGKVDGYKVKPTSFSEKFVTEITKEYSQSAAHDNEIGKQGEILHSSGKNLGKLMKNNKKLNDTSMKNNEEKLDASVENTEEKRTENVIDFGSINEENYTLLPKKVFHPSEEIDRSTSQLSYTTLPNEQESTTLPYGEDQESTIHQNLNHNIINQSENVFQSQIFKSKEYIELQNISSKNFSKDINLQNNTNFDGLSENTLQNKISENDISENVLQGNLENYISQPEISIQPEPQQPEHSSEEDSVYDLSLPFDFGRITINEHPASIPQNSNIFRKSPNADSHKNCADETFQCLSGECLPWLYLCDGELDCVDGSDEGSICGNKTKSCELNEFDCGDGHCIPLQWMCDSEPDCKNTKADESPKNCNGVACKPNEFSCESKSGEVNRCIPVNWVCDNKNDCDDGQDEAICNTTCTSEQFTCASGKCIPSLWRCDGDTDCSDKSDETDCPKKECGPHDSQCSNGECVFRSWICDGEVDCQDHSDELNCGAPVIARNETANLKFFACEHGETLCAKTPLCIQNSYLCDGDEDCPDGSDESDAYCGGKKCGDDSFTCGDGSCVPKLVVCNGFTECLDASDELNCTVQICDPKTEFDCGERCISLLQICDGKKDCSNGRDEAPGDVCAKNECLDMNGGCSHTCVDTKIGHYCSCRPGFMLVRGKQCEDINECLEPGICSQRCVNLKGSYKCECVDGYAKEPHRPQKCKATEGHVSLLYADTVDIRKISVEHNDITSIVNETNGSSALDFVFKTGMLFWTDTKDRCIYKAPIDEGFKKEVVIKDDLTTADGLVVDWIYNHIYWTDSNKNSIAVSDFDGRMQKTLITTKLEQPRSIAIHPTEGWMFWTDWGSSPKIERAGMDGTFRQTIIRTDIRWPNGLTVDLILRRIFWVDSKLHSIFSCDLDGLNRRTVFNSKESLPHPFSISVFEDTLYWTDWAKKSILKADKFTGKNLTMISTTHYSPMTVHVYHSYRQPDGVNHCLPLNGLCTHLCLPAPQRSLERSKVSCACPDGLKLMRDGLTCRREPKNVTSGRSNEPTVVEVETLLADSSDVIGYRGNIVVAVILAAVVVLCLTSAISVFVYRYYKKESENSVNFDNPIYKKTTCEDGINMAASGRSGSHGRVQNGRRSSISSYGHRQYGVITPCEENTILLQSKSGDHLIV